MDIPSKILFVDDEPDFERLMSLRFRKKIKTCEYDLSFASDGIEALNCLDQDSEISVILTDINMPRMDGLNLLKKALKLKRDLIIIIVSAYGDMKNIRTAMNRGAYDFITKPIDFEDLDITITKAIEEYESRALAARTKEQLAMLQLQLDASYELQQSVLPNNFDILSTQSDYEIYAEMIPARDVGGDFYDFFMIDENKLGMIVGDVSGKGMPAALFMAMSMTLLKATALQTGSAAECLKRVNYLLNQDNPKCMFVTVFYGVLDVQTSEFEYCSGGHNMPYLLHGDHRPEMLEKTEGTALGFDEDHPFSNKKVNIVPGQSLVLYTDGVTEAMDSEGQEFSTRRLVRLLNECAGNTSKTIAKEIITNIEEYANDQPQSDDITLMIIRHGLTT